MFNSRFFTARHWLARFWRQGELGDAPVGPFCFTAFIVAPSIQPHVITPNIDDSGIVCPKIAPHVECNCE